jgi:hypothetical protein
MFKWSANYWILLLMYRLSEGEASSGHDAQSHETDGFSSRRTSSEGEASGEDKRRKFEQHRKQHYQMRQAIEM